MNVSLIPFNKNVLSTAVCLGMVAMSPNVQAVILNANTTAQTSGAANTNFATDTALVSINSNGNTDPSTGTAYSRAAGNSGGWMYTNAGGTGAFSATGNIQQVYEFTNSSAFAQSYAFDYTINFGSLRATNNAPLGLGDFATASNKVSIKLDGVEIFNSEARLTTDDTGATSLTTAGAVLGTYTAGSNYYSWSASSATLDLGIFNAGESFVLEYDIFTFGSSNGVVTMDTVCYDYGGYGGYGDYGYGGELIGGPVVPAGTACYDRYNSPTYAYSQFGDPNSLTGTPLNTPAITGTQVSVPEESSFLLFGAGLAGLAFRRRRNNRKS